MSSDITPLASLSLTHVRYNPSDPLSLLSAYLSLLPQALLISYTTLALSTREAEVLLLLAGQLACEALNFILKRLIRQDRPRHIHADTTKGYGMPSSHAQFASFWAVSVVLFLLVRHRGDTPRVPVLRWLRVRDLVVEEDVSLAGWEKWEGRRDAERLKREAAGKKGE
ncbi:hypothetical protein B0T18DRAFT_486723 [Schizothecium vesticola]|uniref:Dolichyldiphosphatase n=1 Tax=Schizothecium vesticola TaxID=314040 RepID=A0AA40KAU3_9PEZI|nr:hypothetical protein B0T18DRAFT_486723 [Schizothecium vesticola]